MTIEVVRPAPVPQPWPVIDLFSGAGGMSYGFHAHPAFKIVGAADAELGKPSDGMGALDCNDTYRANIGLLPEEVDLGSITPKELRARFEASGLTGNPVVMAACPPCTGFSRANRQNHVVDDPRNSLVSRTVRFVEEFGPQVVVMENARELITGKFRRHYDSLREGLVRLGYKVHGSVHMLTRFGLPQIRERALVVAVKSPLPLRTLDDLWAGYTIRDSALTVRRAIGHLPPVRAGERSSTDHVHVSTTVRDPLALRRVRAIPHDGGSWADLCERPDADELLIDSMKWAIANKSMNHYCDVYGRMAWDRPAPTIKRECSHVGNGRYSHPVQDRLCTVREMAILQGFPLHYDFHSTSRKNMYRHIGDAVPPVVSFQLAKLCEWILTGKRPSVESMLLPDTHLRPEDVVPVLPPLDLFTQASLVSSSSSS